MVRKISQFFIFLILNSASKIQKKTVTAKSDILLFFIFLLLLENEKNETISISGRFRQFYFLQRTLVTKMKNA